MTTFAEGAECPEDMDAATPDHEAMTVAAGSYHPVERGISDLRTPPATPDATLDGQLATIAVTLGLEWDSMRRLWWLPAEPGPVECATIADAVREAIRLGDNDHRRANQREAALREKLLLVVGEKAAARVFADAEAKKVIALRAEVERLREKLPAPDEAEALRGLLDKIDYTGPAWWAVAAQRWWDRALASPPPATAETPEARE